MDGSNFAKPLVKKRVTFWDEEKPKWEAARKIREDHDEAVWQEHLAWMKRMEERHK